MRVRIRQQPITSVKALPIDGPRATARILVVDDDPQVRELSRRILVAHGYDVVEAEHGLEAIARLSQFAPDLVLLDLNMPVMDGWQFRAEQRRLSDRRLAATPVVLVTGANGASDEITPLAAVGLLRKPYGAAGLLEAVTSALRA